MFPLRILALLLLGCPGTPVADLLDEDGDGSPAGEDCDDADAAVHPGAGERCDDAGQDEDCDGLVNADDPDAPTVTAWRDADGDDFGAGEARQACPTSRGSPTTTATATTATTT